MCKIICQVNKTISSLVEIGLIMSDLVSCNILNGNTLDHLVYIQDILTYQVCCSIIVPLNVQKTSLWKVQSAMIRVISTTLHNLFYKL